MCIVTCVLCVCVCVCVLYIEHLLGVWCFYLGHFITRERPQSEELPRLNISWVESLHVNVATPFNRLQRTRQEERFSSLW